MASLFKFILLLSLITGLLAGAVGVYLLKEIASQLPDHTKLAEYNPTGITRLFTTDNELLAEQGFERRIYTPIHEIPPHVIDAFLAAEDANFYKHKGVDIKSILRALWVNLTTDRPIQGASTITQQVVKNKLLSPERTLERKIKEAILAYRISNTFSKDKILEIYLNDIYFGAGAYGIGTAARRFFNKTVDELTLEEGALLGALPKAPSKYNPVTNKELAKIRRNLVLERMREERMISPAQAALSKAVEITVTPPELNDTVKAPYFRDEVFLQLEEKLESDILNQKGLMVHTTLDMAYQAIAEKALREGLENYSKRHNAFREDGKTPKVNGATVVLEISTGRVLALAGGYDYRDSQFNRATLAKRQPGSAFKPFVYLAALEQGYSPANRLADEPIALPLVQVSDEEARLALTEEQVWKPKNYSGSFYGLTTLRVGLEKSLNILTVKLAQEIGLPAIKDVAGRFGLNTEGNWEMSAVLGSKETDLLNLTNAYAIIANGGKKVTPHLIERVYDQEGNLLLKPSGFACIGCRMREATPDKLSETPSVLEYAEKVTSPEIAYQTTFMLHGVVERGTARRAKDLGFALAGKTGTTDDSKDAWFIGYTPEIAVGVYVGYDTPKQLGRKETGSSVALPIFIDIMEAIYKQENAPRYFPKPEGVEMVRIDAKTGFLASANTPRSQTIVEAFLPDQIPTMRVMTQDEYYQTYVAPYEQDYERREYYSPYSYSDPFAEPTEDSTPATQEPFYNERRRKTRLEAEREAMQRRFEAPSVFDPVLSGERVPADVRRTDSIWEENEPEPEPETATPAWEPPDFSPVPRDQIREIERGTIY